MFEVFSISLFFKAESLYVIIVNEWREIHLFVIWVKLYEISPNCLGGNHQVYKDRNTRILF